MPEPLPPGLPGRVAPPSFPTRSVDAALRAAAGRRRRRAAAVSGSALAVLLAAATAALLLPTAPDDDRLSVATPITGVTAEPSSAATPEPSAAPGEQAPQPEATSEPRATRAAGDPQPEPSPEVAPEAAAEPTTAPPPPGTDPEAAPPSEVGPPSEVVPMRSGQACDGSGPTPAQGWCSYYDGQLEAAHGQTAILAAAVCRIAGQGAGKLFADSGEHASFVVGGRWRWGHGRRFSPEPATFTVQPGECIRWFVTWDLADDAGNPLRPGTYYLEALPLVSARTTDNGAGAYVDNTYAFRITG